MIQALGRCEGHTVGVHRVDALRILSQPEGRMKFLRHRTRVSHLRRVGRGDDQRQRERIRPLTLEMIRRLSEGLGLPADILVQRYSLQDAA